MTLQKLEIKRQLWGPNSGQFQATICVDDSQSQITMQLSPDACERLLASCIDELVSATESAAHELKDRLTKATQTPALK
jgi:hypothetical protein